jgi:eukaryotic-like serine/threonine-protein kinase
MYDAEIDHVGGGKLNCWEFKKCGRELGGENAFALGVCPAAIDVMLDSVHDGISAGRACWVIVGTMCSGTVQGSFAQKYKSCAQCDFYAYVKEGEGEDLIPTVSLLEMLD